MLLDINRIYAYYLLYRENRPKANTICVANHTTPFDWCILASDVTYAVVRLFHSLFCNFISPFEVILLCILNNSELCLSVRNDWVVVIGYWIPKVLPLRVILILGVEYLIKGEITCHPLSIKVVVITLKHPPTPKYGVSLHKIMF